MVANACMRVSRHVSRHQSHDARWNERMHGRCQQNARANRTEGTVAGRGAVRTPCATGWAARRKWSAFFQRDGVVQLCAVQTAVLPEGPAGVRCGRSTRVGNWGGGDVRLRDAARDAIFHGPGACRKGKAGSSTAHGRDCARQQQHSVQTACVLHGWNHDRSNVARVSRTPQLASTTSKVRQSGPNNITPRLWCRNPTFQCVSCKPAP